MSATTTKDTPSSCKRRSSMACTSAGARHPSRLVAAFAINDQMMSVGPPPWDWPSSSCKSRSSMAIALADANDVALVQLEAQKAAAGWLTGFVSNDRMTSVVSADERHDDKDSPSSWLVDGGTSADARDLTPVQLGAQTGATPHRWWLRKQRPTTVVWAAAVAPVVVDFFWSPRPARELIVDGASPRDRVG